MTLRPEQLLAPALEAARRALRDLDDDQVPASLRRIAAYSGGTLPPPFARSLLTELDSNEFLRERALEAWSEDKSDSGPRLASRAFLEREGEWALIVASVAHEEGGRGATRTDRTLEVERDALAAEVASLRERLKASRKDATEAENRLREAVREGRRPQRAERAAEQRFESRLEEIERRREAEQEALRSELQDATERLERAREELREQRRQGTLAREASAGREGPIPTDPDGLVRHLDLMAGLVGADAILEDLASASVIEGLDYPAAVRPDASEVVDWLRTVEDVDLIIDGYNLGFLLAGDTGDPPRARWLALEVAGRLAAVAPGVRITIVFDSEIESEAESVPEPGPGRVLYSEGRIADDMVVELAGASHRAVVVSNDREVRTRSESVGAVALWADGIAAWSRRR